MEGNSNRVPHFVSAMTPKKLQQEMLRVNTEGHMQYNWQITHDGKKWVAWYYAVINDDIMI